ncbi:hypothetical protein NBH00_08560 [Paraconexibacter antarcticus]|uniref:TPM domain-containing protein n=1 Tax=Paraconexibacter antarcticus TaxID=2949664 RepID=A0ABY5DW66_9ACTN|nr:hypothetical protein [Paraconexibacter antarcticus]UTI66245.1 hypothetical protein NBH00_08560 [Paraconexibacter antarcticus]
MPARSRLPLLAVLAMLLPAAPAIADGDPASDTLPSAAVFLPYAPPVQSQTATRLGALLREATRERLAIKVAVIGSPADLGAVTSLFGHPQAYATFLGREIQPYLREQHSSLLIAMPAGFGLIGPAATTAAQRALAASRRPISADSTTLTAAATAAVERVAVADGLRLVHPALTGARHGDHATRTAYLLSLAAVVAAAVLLAARVRRPAPGALAR